jgi:hypothetical protein
MSGSSDTAFAHGAYRQICDQVPDDEQIQTVLGLLASGKSREQILYEMYAAPERAQHLGRADWTFLERHAYGAFEFLNDMQIAADPRLSTVVAFGIIRRGDADVFRSVKLFFDRNAIPSGRVRLTTVARVNCRSPKSVVRGLLGLVEGNVRWADLRVKLARLPFPSVDLGPVAREFERLRHENERLENRIIEISTRLRHLDQARQN